MLVWMREEKKIIYLFFLLLKHKVNKTLKLKWKRELLFYLWDFSNCSQFSTDRDKTLFLERSVFIVFILQCFSLTDLQQGNKINEAK